MNPGPAEEVGKVAGTFMDIMRGNPLALALCVMNLTLLALFFYVARTASDNRRHEFETLLESQKETNKLLFQCVPSPGFKLQSDDSRIVPLPQVRPENAPKN